MASPFGPCPACQSWECVQWARGTGRPCSDDASAREEADINAAFRSIGVNDPLVRGATKAALSLAFRLAGKPVPPVLASAERDIGEGVRGLKNELRAAMRRKQ